MLTVPSSLRRVEFNADLIEKYNCAVPRYTSYPPATEMSEQFVEFDFRRAIALGNHQKTPLSLYCHIPFCETPCYFCGCNMVITQRKEVATPYLDYLYRHIHQVADWVSGDRLVEQMHWGGGTPNYLTIEQIAELWRVLHDRFKFAPDAELSIEVNPRFLDRDYLLSLREIGFNRISFGIQDFNPQVQEAINRIQPESMLFDVMGWMREAAFDSVNVDLIYGLPFQTTKTFRTTVEKTLQLNPDRIAVFNFAYVPWLKPIQRRIPYSELPSPTEKLDILHETIDQLTQNGYVFIGMDHFAKPDDELAIAQRQGVLHRNFQGYTTKPESDLLSFGMTAISMLQDVYVQSPKRLRDYYQAIDENHVPIERGCRLNADDVIRRAVIMELMCQFQLSLGDLSEKYGLNLYGTLRDWFAREYIQLEALAADGLIELSDQTLRVTPIGRLLVRNVAAVFDTYLQRDRLQGFSQAV